MDVYLGHETNDALEASPQPLNSTRLCLTPCTPLTQAATSVAEIAFAEKTANKFELQKLVYGELRHSSPTSLAAQLAIRCISKASEAYKRDKSIQPTFRPEGALVYDERVMSFKGLTTVSLLTLSGRVLVPFLIGSYQASRMGSIKGQADLLYRNGDSSPWQ